MKRLPETDRLEYQLQALGRRVQAQHVHRGMVVVLTMTCVFFLAGFAADYLTRFPYWLRVGMLGAGVIYAGWWFRRRALKPASRVLDAQEVSLLVERDEPSLQSRLISTLQWQEKQQVDSGTSEDLVNGMVDQTFDMIDSVPMSRIVDTRWRGKAFKKLLLAALIVGGVAYLLPNYTLVFCKRLVLPDVSYPTLTRIVNVDIPELIPLGDPITIGVEGDGRLPDLGRILIRTDDGDYIEYDLHPQQEGSHNYQADLAGLSQPATMYVELGDAEFGPVSLDPIPRPNLESISASVRSPAYSGIEDRSEQTGNLRVLEGSSIEFTFVTTKACPNFAMVSTGAADAELPTPKSDDGRTWTCSMQVSESVGFTLEMTDDQGLAAADVPQYRVTAIRDRSPVIKIDRPDGASEMAPVSRIPLEFTVNDDLGIDSIRIEYIIENSEIDANDFGTVITREVPRKIYQRIDNIGRTTYTVNGWWENNKTTVRPGQIIRFWIIAEDNAPTKHVSESDEMLIRVISSAEYRRVLWSKLGEHIERVDEMVIEIKGSNNALENVGEKMQEDKP